MTIDADAQLVARYKKNYGIPDSFPLKGSECRFHWDLERSFRAELLSSKPQDRREVFSRCYERLYSELPWLHAGAADANPQYFRPWELLLGKPPCRVYEVGSGRGALLHYLAERGYQCRGSEITEERGARHVSPHENLSWGTTDGVHLSDFEPAGTFDAVISDQVVEHLHPDDLIAHLQGALNLLKPGGGYFFRTPSFYAGPADISLVFTEKTPQGMHLKEYKCNELRTAAIEAGFGRVYGVLRVPEKLPWLGRKVKVSSLYTHVALGIDACPAFAGRMLARAGVLPKNVWIAAFKTVSTSVEVVAPSTMLR